MNHLAKCIAVFTLLQRGGTARWLLGLVIALLLPTASALAQATGPPVIQSQPQNQSVFAGASVSFSVVASGAQPLTYQWYKITMPGTPSITIMDATNATLKLSGVDEPDAGNYFVVVANAFGMTRSTDAILSVTRVDFGDAPAVYPTLLASGGAAHRIVKGVYLADGVSFEPDGQPDANAALDTFDDGVTFLNALVPGNPCTVRVVASTRGFLDAWIDFNANGSWFDPGDQIFQSALLSPGTNILSFFVPVGTQTPTGNTFARFRFSTSGGLRPTGFAQDGEVEDYAV